MIGEPRCWFILCLAKRLQSTNLLHALDFYDEKEAHSTNVVVAGQIALANGYKPMTGKSSGSVFSNVVVGLCAVSAFFGAAAVRAQWIHPIEVALDVGTTWIFAGSWLSGRLGNFLVASRKQSTFRDEAANCENSQDVVHLAKLMSAGGLALIISGLGLLVLE